MWMYGADASLLSVGMSTLFVPSILSQLQSSMPHFAGTCMMENELVREISRGEVAK